MRFVRRRCRLIAAVWIVALAVQTTGCSGWVPVTSPSLQTVAERRWTDLRVTVAGDLGLELAQVGVSADSLVGILRKVRVGARQADSATFREVLGRFGGRDSVVAVPFAAVIRLDRYSDELGPLPILILGGLMVAGAVAVGKIPIGAHTIGRIPGPPSCCN